MKLCILLYPSWQIITMHLASIILAPLSHHTHPLWHIITYHSCIVHYTCLSRSPHPPIKEKLLSPKAKYQWHPPKTNVQYHQQSPTSLDNSPYIQHSIPSNSYANEFRVQYSFTLKAQFSLAFNISTSDIQLSPTTIGIPKVQPSIAFQTSTLLGSFPSKEDRDTLKHFQLEAQFPLACILYIHYMYFISCISTHSSHSIHCAQHQGHIMHITHHQMHQHKKYHATAQSMHT